MEQVVDGTREITCTIDDLGSQIEVRAIYVAGPRGRKAAESLASVEFELFCFILSSGTSCPDIVNPTSQDSSNAVVSLLNVCCVKLLARGVMREFRVMSSIGKIQCNQGVTKIGLDATDRPSIQEAVGKENVAGMIGKFITCKMPLLH